jgi:hypothetical protein
MQTTTQALEMKALPFQPEKIPELGCGNGGTTMVLTAQTGARITAIDTENAAFARPRQVSPIASMRAVWTGRVCRSRTSQITWSGLSAAGTSSASTPRSRPGGRCCGRAVYWRAPTSSGADRLSGEMYVLERR